MPLARCRLHTLPHTSRDCEFVPPFVLEDSRRNLGQDFEKVAIDQIRLSHTARHIAAVQLAVAKFEPFAQVL